MSGISSIGSTFIPLTTGTSSTQVSNAGTQSSSPLPFDVRQDGLGVPLAGGSLGLPTGGAPGDTEALLALVALKLRQTMGTMSNNAVETRMSQYMQQLQQAQSLIAAYVNASLTLTNSQQLYQTANTALTAVNNKLGTLYAPLTGSDTQQNIQAVTADPTGKQGTYGQYLSAFSEYTTKNTTYQGLVKQVNDDIAANQTAINAASKTDPNGYYLTVYMARQTQQQQLQQNQQTLAGKNPPQQLQPADQLTLQTLNGTGTGSVQYAAAQYQQLVDKVSSTGQTLSNDQTAKQTAFNNLVTSEEALIPYLDYKNGTFTDQYPQSGGPQTYTFEQQAINGSTPNATGIISSSLNLIRPAEQQKNGLIQTLKDLQAAITSATTTLANFGANGDSQDPTKPNPMLVLLNLTQSLTSALAQHSSDQSSTGNSNQANDAMLQNRFERNENNVDALNENQDVVSKITELRRRIAAMLDNRAGQTAIQLASSLTDTLLALASLVDQPPVVPATNDVFQNTSSQSSSPRMRIPV